MNIEISTNKAPGAIGPYSQAIQAGGFIYTSGQLPIDPQTGEFAGECVVSQTKKSLENVKAILDDAGFSMSDVIKTTVYLADIKDFVKMNEVYSEFFIKPFPARSAFEAACLPKNALVEIEVVAHKVK